MPTIKEDWIAKNRLSQLLAAEIAVARAASHLALHVRGEAARAAAEEAATSAWWAAEVLTKLVPRTVIRRSPRRGLLLTRLLRTAARVSDDLALVVLGWAMSVMARRMRWALDVISIDAQEALLRGVLPQRMTAIQHLRRYRNAEATPRLEAAP